MLDVDDRSNFPDWIQDLPDTFTVESPHGGHHLYYIVEDDTDIWNTKIDGGSIRYYGQYVVGPGSTIDHDGCNDGKPNCPGEGTGTYDILSNKPIATLFGDYLEHLREACTTDNDIETLDYDPISDADSDLIHRGDLALHTLQEISTPAFTALMDFLQGGVGEVSGDNGFDVSRKENGKIDRTCLAPIDFVTDS